MNYRIFSLFLILISTSHFAKSQSTFFTGGNICSDADWNLVFNDEFDTDSLDRSKWINYFPYSANGDDQCEFCRTHGDEGQIFTDTNLELSNGTLKIFALKQTATWFSATRDYTSSLIHSKNDFRFHYGRFEMRCKIPSGKGLYSAFWVFGGDNMGSAMEIDIFEFSGRISGHHHFALWEYAGSDLIGGQDHTYTDEDFSKAFHIYSVDWDPFFITFMVDGNEVYKISRFYTLAGTKVDWCCVVPGVYGVLPEYPKGENMFVNLIAGLSIETGDDAPDENTLFPAQLEIDYIRVYQRDPPSSKNYDCEVLLYPNPAMDKLNIKKKKMTKIKIENIDGQILFSKDIQADEYEVNIKDLKPGIYFVEVQSEDSTFANKFVKY